MKKSHGAGQVLGSIHFVTARDDALWRPALGGTKRDALLCSIVKGTGYQSIETRGTTTAGHFLTTTGETLHGLGLPRRSSLV